MRSVRPPLRVLDLFAGCGGLSLGFDAAGFYVTAALEFDPVAHATHLRHFGRSGTRLDEPADITAVSADDLAGPGGIGPIDVVIGGPPCQAYARVGRAKLREVMDHPEAFLHDPRGDLYRRYLAIVAVLRPAAVVMENVPDVMNLRGVNVAEEVAGALAASGYRVAYTLLNAAFFGVPQMRERMFLIAVSDRVGRDVAFPEPTHRVDLPPGYHGSRRVAMRGLRRTGGTLLDPDGGNGGHFRTPPTPADDLPPAVTAEDALCDLPPLTHHLRGLSRRGARRFDRLVPYADARPPNTFTTLMRNWPRFEAGRGVKDHVIRHLPRDWAIFGRMRPGDQYPEAHATAEAMFAERLAAAEADRGLLTDADRADLRKATVPPYDPGKFPNKWRKMEADRPARTLMAHLGKDTYSHIHYDSDQARTISVREAARLQSFPDGFTFCGTMNPAFRQIGNAVPPLLAWAVADAVRDTLQPAPKSADEAGPQTSFEFGPGPVRGPIPEQETVRPEGHQPEQRRLC